MEALVKIQNDQVVTSSRVIAQEFEKQHKNVLQGIERLDCSSQFTGLNFQPSEYTDPTGRKLKEYIITRDGFMFLVMGFTGSKAAKMKESFISAFNKMEAALKDPQNWRERFNVPATISEALRLAATQAEQIEEQRKAMKLLEERNDNLSQQNEVLVPKGVFSDAVSASKTSILVGELAKILKQNGIEIGQNRLFEQLRKDGFLISRKGSDYNMPTQKAMELELFEIKETSITHSDGHISISKTAKVTGKGQVYFVNRFLGRGKVVKIA